MTIARGVIHWIYAGVGEIVERVEATAAVEYGLEPFAFQGAVRDGAGVLINGDLMRRQRVQ